MTYYEDQPISGDTYVTSYAAVEPLVTVGSQAELTDDEQWQPLGVFALIPQGATEVANYVQLAVTRHGIVRGYMSTPGVDESQEVNGSVDASNLRIGFATSADDALQFESSVPNLAQAESVVNVYNPADQTATAWQMVRQEAPANNPAQQQ